MALPTLTITHIPDPTIGASSTQPMDMFLIMVPESQPFNHIVSFLKNLSKPAQIDVPPPLYKELSVVLFFILSLEVSLSDIIRDFFDLLSADDVKEEKEAEVEVEDRAWDDWAMNN
ncbi:hypothetical protein LguiA_012360 [Lonicera macranthoides]